MSDNEKADDGIGGEFAPVPPADDDERERAAMELAEAQPVEVDDAHEVNADDAHPVEEV